MGSRWNDEYPSEKRIFVSVVGWTVALVVLVGALSAGLWAFGVFSSNVKGAGDAIRQRNSGVNRVQKQEMFEQIVADFDGYIVKIKVAKDALKAATGADVSLRQTDLEGLRLTCIDAAQQFNAESRKYSSRVWKSAGLPLTLDPEECA